MEEKTIKVQVAVMKQIETKIKRSELQIGVTTERAFEALLADKEMWEKTGESIDTLYYVRNINKNKKHLTLDRKFELLKKAGFVEETVWKLK